VAEQEKRLALNEALFREINERLEARIPVAVAGDERLAVLCECADADCTERIPITPGEYEAVRSDPRQFVVVPGHECVNVENVVSSNDRFEIVRKTGVAGEFAELLDPTPQ
jgi:hypothetical protein